MMTQSLFLSYARKDNEDGFIKRLYERLIAEKIKLWWDMQSMPARELTFLTEIRNAVHQHERLILVASPNAFDSKYVEAEWRYALNVCKPVHVILRGGDYPDLPPDLALKDAPDFRDDADFEKAFEHLQRHLAQDPENLGALFGTRPALPAWYIERDGIMENLDNSVLIDSKQPVVVLSKQQVTAMHGMGGIGKSITASAFSQRCATRRYFTDGIFWLTLGKNPEITSRQADIGMHFGDERNHYLSPEIGLNRLQALLNDKKVLLILDDVWEKSDAEAFRIQGNFNRLLMTTRSRRLVTQLAAMQVELAKLSDDEGLRLFDERLSRKADERLHENTEREIIRFLNGYTLAVALAAARLHEEGADYAPRLLERLKKRKDSENPFRSLNLDDEDKNENIEISLSLSYEDLKNDKLRRRFRMLGVLAPNAPFTLELAQALWGDEDDEDTEDALSSLVNAALLQHEKGSDYEQHIVLRAYALALLIRENEAEATRLHYFNHIVSEAAQFDKLPPEEWHKLDKTIPHVEYVGDSLAADYAEDESLHQTAAQFAYNITHYLFRRREVKREAWLQMGLKLAQNAADEKRQALFLNELGVMASSLGDKQQALEYHQEALRLRKQVGDIRGEAITLNELGLIADALGNKQQALDYYKEALPLNKQVGDISSEATTLSNIGVVYYRIGNIQQALDTFQQTLPMHREVGNKTMEATTLNNIGMVYSALGEKQKALDTYQEALPMHRQVGNKAMEATTLNNIGDVYYRIGNIQQALDYHQQALLLRKQVGDKGGEAITLNNIGAVYNALGEKQKALDYYQQVLPILRQVGDRFNESSLLGNISIIYHQQGNFNEAIRYLEQSVAIQEEVGHPDAANYRTALERWKQERDAGG